MLLPSSIAVAFLSLGIHIHATTAAAAAPPEYHENLYLRPLPGSSLLASFTFRTNAPTASFATQNFPLFPRSLGQILQHAHTKELHLRFSSGRWDSESWGPRPRAGVEEGGTGVELWAWVEADTEQQLTSRWLTLTNALSGLFCASLNFIDSTRTLKPVLTFDPQGDHVNSSSRNLHLLHGTLPGEIVCTENLTPFLKLLPCKGKAGISTLLDGHKIFDSSWQTMAIDVRPVCPNGAGGECFVEMEQSVDMVVSIERAKRPRDDPIPRPLPIEEVSCDTSKYYHAYGDACFPLEGPASPSFNLWSVFGNQIYGACPHADQKLPDGDTLCLGISPERVATVQTAGQYTDRTRDGMRCLGIPVGVPFDINFDEQKALAPLPPGNSLVRAERTLTGYGQQHGGMRTVLTNPSPTDDITVSYFEPMPWFMKIYLHTIRVKSVNSDGTYRTVDPTVPLKKIIHRPAVDRVRGSHLELLLVIPANTRLIITYDFEKSILRYSEYPPDANRGFNVASAVVRVLDGPEGGRSYIRTTSLLLYLPTPDFSMPYNVIILSSTVVALAFGNIFNLLVRRFVARDEGPSGGRIQNLIMTQIARLRAKLTAAKSKKE